MSSDTVASTSPSTPTWRVVDIVVASVIGVAFGVVYWAWGIAYNGLSTPLQVLPGLSSILGGVWLIAGVTGGLVIRKPGAAIYTELLAAVVSAVVGTQWGFLTLVSGAVQGLGAELVFAVFLYRRFGVWVAALAGAAAGLALAINDLILWYPGVTATFRIVYVVGSLISGFVIAGVLGFYLVQALARAGVLSRFAAGREVTREV
ncbi:ECF transporter S component [Mycobacterium sp. M26]|uniref:ECF transporter S component n=1 Tax=Mycobacterium sp. M26 TaxID=1762962 RepID=UPI00073F7D34|nr:ECF transporter S component [Mycobacterium sp. M26]